jgi:hypothetical protein
LYSAKLRRASIPSRRAEAASESVDISVVKARFSSPRAEE